MHNEITYLDVVDTSRSRTLLCQLADCLQTCFFLSLPVALLPPRSTVLVLFASLAFVPRALVDDAHFVATCRACEDVPFFAVRMDLSERACSTPSKVGWISLAQSHFESTKELVLSGAQTQPLFKISYQMAHLEVLHCK